MNIANPTADCSFHTSGGLPWSINQLRNGRASFVPSDCSCSTSTSSLMEEAVTGRRSKCRKQKNKNVCFVGCEQVCSSGMGAVQQLVFHGVFVCFSPSVMQKTLRKASIWAEMGDSLQCRAKTQDLKVKQTNHQSHSSGQNNVSVEAFCYNGGSKDRTQRGENNKRCSFFYRKLLGGNKVLMWS